MKKIFAVVAIAVSGLIFVLMSFTYTPLVDAVVLDAPQYDVKLLHSRDGIGKFYMGREIAKVIGHQEMLWLERPSRELAEQPNQVIQALNLRPTDVVADIGAGTGYFSFRLAAAVPEGKVLAVDIQPEMLEVINLIKNDENVSNIEMILGTVQNPNLPANSIDLALIVDAYHEFEYPWEMMERILESLKPGGRLVLVEYRRENPFIPIKALHKMSERQIKKEIEAVGFLWQETSEVLPQQHLVFFQKPEIETDSPLELEFNFFGNDS